jgi:hypothetical protein
LEIIHWTKHFLPILSIFILSFTAGARKFALEMGHKCDEDLRTDTVKRKWERYGGNIGLF